MQPKEPNKLHLKLNLLPKLGPYFNITSHPVYCHGEIYVCYAFIKQNLIYFIFEKLPLYSLFRKRVRWLLIDI